MGGWLQSANRQGLVSISAQAMWAWQCGTPTDDSGQSAASSNNRSVKGSLAPISCDIRMTSGSYLRNKSVE
jgi:hypothetical protein